MAQIPALPISLVAITYLLIILGETTGISIPGIKIIPPTGGTYVVNTYSLEATLEQDFDLSFFSTLEDTKTGVKFSAEAPPGRLGFPGKRCDDEEKCGETLCCNAGGGKGNQCCISGTCTRRGCCRIPNNQTTCLN